MEEISVAAPVLFEIAGIAVTNTAFWIVLIAIGLAVFFASVFGKAKIVPGKVQNFLEFILETFLDFCDSITNSRSKTLQIFPFAMTLFLLIWASNLLELAPGLGVFPILRSPSSDLNFTFGLAALSMFYVNYLALRNLGLVPYLGKFFNFKSPVSLFVGLLELMGEFTRIISLSMRLFGNLFAGEVLLMVVSSGIHWALAYFVPLPFLGLEVLVGFLQAFIFSSLIVVFYSTATEAHA
ncbi:MAG: F0F1 ATP synthase subunit A [Candidatus Nealsonbacteria bacterium DGGOD1a]|jgi:F0F1-type ATP synthase, subunit a|nr:MAG: F0F1 ATP synthase subunit A [Candidatus Nealsonbacteria bacterium DGGOD1a]